MIIKYMKQFISVLSATFICVGIELNIYGLLGAGILLAFWALDLIINDKKYNN